MKVKKIFKNLDRISSDLNQIKTVEMQKKKVKFIFYIDTVCFQAKICSENVTSLERVMFFKGKMLTGLHSFFFKIFILCL